MDDAHQCCSMGQLLRHESTHQALQNALSNSRLDSAPTELVCICARNLNESSKQKRGLVRGGLDQSGFLFMGPVCGKCIKLIKRTKSALKLYIMQKHAKHEDTSTSTNTKTSVQ